MKLLNLLLLLLASAAAQDHALHAFASARSARWAPMAGVALTVNTTLLQKSGSWVEVSWSGVKNPTTSDVLAMFVPEYALINITSPVKYKNSTGGA